MRTFRKHLEEKLKDKSFRELYEEEKQLAELSLKVHAVREKLGFTQEELAKRAKITQQQLSKIENGINCNVITFLKVCKALNLKLDITQDMFLSH